ncbi:Omp85 family outer membrane protein [Sunxiuqinia indica]|uniref:Omp85 family outer membrane protein n=1 Tax=Sunxiuqinia indica TaxID=2692584 RepID=UPI00135B498F|nr:BamA/TamA family outer membrane protein [Sunxiuqinia indica]
MKSYQILFLLLLIRVSVFSQSGKNEQTIKSGWNFGALPAITFDNDLGFQYGAFVNLFDYGDGSRYPNYGHSLYLEVSRYTKGSGVYRFYYDSDQLIQGVQTSMDLSYLTDQAYDFYGFNGYDAVFNKNWIDEDAADYRTRMFYKYDRNLFRWKIDLQGKITNERVRWIAGFNFLNFKIDKVNLEKLNEGKSGSDVLPDVPGLYEHYIDWGIIKEEEADGGFVPTFKGGLVWDTRDNKPNPMKGIWAEAVLLISPNILGAESSFSKLSLTHRQYFTIIPDDLSLAYRIAWQTTLSGDVPFYYQSQVITSVMKGATSEGLGGSKTLRGIRRNRVVGDGFLLGNVELRWKFARFQLLNNNFYLGLNGFFDFGQVTDKIEFVNPLSPEMSSIRYGDYFKDHAEQMHISYGAGLRIAMNQNFIIALDYGIAADERDGDSGFYMGLNYLF